MAKKKLEGKCAVCGHDPEWRTLVNVLIVRRLVADMGEACWPIVKAGAQALGLLPSKHVVQSESHREEG